MVPIESASQSISSWNLGCPEAAQVPQAGLVGRCLCRARSRRQSTICSIVRAQGFEFGGVNEIAENQKTLLFELLVVNEDRGDLCLNLLVVRSRSQSHSYCAKIIVDFRLADFRTLGQGLKHFGLIVERRSVRTRLILVR